VGTNPNQRPDSDKPSALDADCRPTAQNGPPADNRARTGAVCRFEAVRALGYPEITRLAGLQHGCAHREQFLAAGISRKAVARLVRVGRLRRLSRDVYLVDRPSLGPWGAEMAAVLHFRGDAVLSGRSAALVWGLTEDSSPVVEVTLVGRNAEPQPGIRIHRVQTLDRHDVRWKSGIPLTAPTRTLIDLAATVEPFELENAFVEARRRGLASDREIRAAIARAPKRQGATTLTQLLEAEADPQLTRSIYERKLIALVTAANLPTPLANAVVEGMEVDLYWPDRRLVVEFDSFTFHRDRRAFERDRERDQKLVAAGYRVIRITAWQLDPEPFAVIARLAVTLR